MKFLNSILIRPAFVFIALLMSFQTAMAQSDISSLYSLFGPGIPIHRQSISLAGMGGSGVAIFDPFRLNLSNPAVQAYHLEPVFEFGGRGTFSTYMTEEASFDNSAFTINNISLSFPLKRGSWGLSMGIVPYSSVGYEVSSSGFDEATSRNFISEYSGSGGLSRAYIGTGARIFNRVDSANNVTSLALGGNFNYNFGTVVTNRLIYFPDNTSQLGVTSTEKILIRDVSAELGLHFNTNLIKRTTANGRYLKFLVGLVYDMGGNLRSELTNSAFNLRVNSTGAVSARDTLTFSDRQKGRVNIPGRFTVGMAFDYVSTDRRRIRLSADYSMQEWSAYKVSFDNNSRSFDFNNSERYSGGIEFTPSISSLNVFERIEYRVGFKYEQTGLNLRETAIEDYGISFGLSVPLHYRRGLTQSTFHVATEYGQYGTTQNGLIQEDYLRIYVGFSFTPNFRNKWFVQPKYD